MKNGSIFTSCCGPSSSLRSFSLSGLPIVNVPPGIGTILNDAVVPGIFSTYGPDDPDACPEAGWALTQAMLKHPNPPDAIAIASDTFRAARHRRGEKSIRTTGFLLLDTCGRTS
jgi:hypothetical protein